MNLSEDFVERLKKTFLSNGISEIVFGLDVFDDMDADDYIVFKEIYNNYRDKHDTGEGV